MARKRVKKSEIKKELTDITVEEVSLVDVPANQRKFLVVKNADGSPAEVQKEEAAPAPEPSKEEPAVEGPPPINSSGEEKPGEEVHKEETASEPVVDAQPAAAAVAEAPAVEAPAPEAPPAEVVKSDDAPVYRARMGANTKKAVLGIVSLLKDKLVALEALVSDAEEAPSEFVDWNVVYDLNYIVSLACEGAYAVECMSGPTWEINAAATAELAKSLTGLSKEARVEKVGRALSKDRLDTLKGIHSGMDDCLKELKSFIKAHDTGVEKSAGPDLSGELEAAKARIGELEEVNKSLRQKLDEPGRPNAGAPVAGESRSTMNRSFPRAWVGGKRI